MEYGRYIDQIMKNCTFQCLSESHFTLELAASHTCIPHVCKGSAKVTGQSTDWKLCYWFD